MAKHKDWPQIVTYESEATLKVRMLVFINLKTFISEKSAVEKLCDHTEANTLYCASAFQD